MDADLIRRWNAVVKRGDSVWHLGDFSWHGSEDIFHLLNGEKHLIVGNHDSRRTLKMPWASVHQYHELSLRENGVKTKVVLFHYPIEEWDGFFKGTLHLHGHNHGRLANRKNRWDVGVDVWDYQPVTLDQIKASV